MGEQQAKLATSPRGLNPTASLGTRITISSKLVRSARPARWSIESCAARTPPFTKIFRSELCILAVGALYIRKYTIMSGIVPQGG